jgi:S-formylglutathione hydrolase FrmB
MILEEYLPLLGGRGLGVDWIGLHGESMGGYGALLLAQRTGRARIAAVAVDAPAIFRSAGATAPGAFDDEADFDRNDVRAGSDKLLGIPIRIVCGTQDPFYEAVKEFVRLGNEPAVQTSYERAGHSPGYWRTQTAAQLDFLAMQLPGPSTIKVRDAG